MSHIWRTPIKLLANQVTTTEGVYFDQYTVKEGSADMFLEQRLETTSLQMESQAVEPAVVLEMDAPYLKHESKDYRYGREDIMRLLRKIVLMRHVASSTSYAVPAPWSVRRVREAMCFNFLARRAVPVPQLPSP